MFDDRMNFPIDGKFDVAFCQCGLARKELPLKLLYLYATVRSKGLTKASAYNRVKGSEESDQRHASKRYCQFKIEMLHDLATVVTTDGPTMVSPTHYIYRVFLINCDVRKQRYLAFRQNILVLKKILESS